MRFKDEKVMWYSDTERLAALLEDKSKEEIQEILEEHDVIKLRSIDRPKTTGFNRVALVIFFIPVLTVSGVKWFLTGDRYLDSWAKQSRTLRTILKFMGES